MEHGNDYIKGVRLSLFSIQVGFKMQSNGKITNLQGLSVRKMLTAICPAFHKHFTGWGRVGWGGEAGINVNVNVPRIVKREQQRHFMFGGEAGD